MTKYAPVHCLVSPITPRRKRLFFQRVNQKACAIKSQHPPLFTSPHRSCMTTSFAFSQFRAYRPIFFQLRTGAIRTSKWIWIKCAWYKVVAACTPLCSLESKILILTTILSGSVKCHTCHENCIKWLRCEYTLKSVSIPRDTVMYQ